MRLAISHTTRYGFDAPPAYGLQQLRLTPKSNAGQRVIDWDIDIEGAQTQAIFTDEHHNQTHNVAINPGAKAVVITSHGAVEMTDMNGIIGAHSGFTPLWLFTRSTALTQPADNLRELSKTLPKNAGVSDFHNLSKTIGERVTYMTGTTEAITTAEQALNQGQGVCQDHAQIFITAARLAGHPARYVSGYLMMNDRVDQNATHAWAEVWLDGLGWTGFDVSNGISPDMRYVKLATGLDYKQAAPISGLTLGGTNESINVEVHVQQQ